MTENHTSWSREVLTAMCILSITVICKTCMAAAPSISKAPITSNKLKHPFRHSQPFITIIHFLPTPVFSIKCIKLKQQDKVYALNKIIGVIIQNYSLPKRMPARNITLGTMILKILTFILQYIQYNSSLTTTPIFYPTSADEVPTTGSAEFILTQESYLLSVYLLQYSSHIF